MEIPYNLEPLKDNSRDAERFTSIQQCAAWKADILSFVYPYDQFSKRTNAL